MTADLADPLAELLAVADRAFDLGDEDAALRSLSKAATVLRTLYEQSPVELPTLLESLLCDSRCISTAVRTAADMAADAVAESTVERPAVLHVECSAWVAIACSLHHGADPRRVTAAATLHMSTEGVRRLDGRPLDDNLRTLAGSCTSADLRAGIEVREQHADALAQQARRTAALWELVGPYMVDNGALLGEALGALDDPEWSEAEALLADLPLFVALGGGGSR